MRSARGGVGPEATISLRDDQLVYLRMNPRTFTPFGLGPLEVAFETVNSFLGAHRFAGKLASNAVVQYALWINEATQTQHERLIRWWQDEIEGTGRVPILSTQQKPEVLRFASGTDADLRLSWQQFLIRMIANAFNLPPMLLGLEQDVNRSTSGEMGDEAFRSAILPLARLVEQHITRDVFSKLLGWNEFEFAFNELETRDELTELQIQTQLLQAGVLTVDEVRGDARAAAVDAAGGEDPGGTGGSGNGRLMELHGLMGCDLDRDAGDGMRLRAMAVEMPVMAGHPNRVAFEGVLTFVDVASDRAPSGANGHKVILARDAVTDALPSLLGMAVDYCPRWDGHDARRKCGIITDADVEGQQLKVAGYLFGKDFPEVEHEMTRLGEGSMGMSYELADAHVEDMNAEVWTLRKVTFTGAAILLKSKAAYAGTHFAIRKTRQTRDRAGMRLA